MKYDLKVQNGVAEFSFAIDSEAWEKEMDASYRRNKMKYSIPGFRKGHATRKMIENAYGPQVFFDEAFNACASEAYSTALKEHEEIFPVDEPNLSIDDLNDDGIKFTIKVTLKPEVVLGDYKGLKLEKFEYKTEEKDIQAEIDKALERMSREVAVTDRAVKDGDIVVLDYSGSVDGVKFDGGTAEKQNLTIGSKSFIPGFEEQMIGMNIGETRDLKVSFPADYHAENLKGKEAVFTVTVHEIKVKEKPEANDQFAKDTSKFENFNDYKNDIKNRLDESNKRRGENETKNNLVEKIAENATVEIPKCMIDSELNYMLQDMEYRLSYMYQGMKLEDYFKYTGTTVEDFKKDRHDEALKAVKVRLTLEAVIKAEKIEPTDAEVDAKLAEVAKNANKSLEEYKAGINPQQLNYIKNDILMNKTLEFLVANNTLEVGAKAEKKAATAKKAAEGGEEKPATAKKTTAAKAKKE